MINAVMSHALRSVMMVVLVSCVTGCVMNQIEPLATERLQEELKDPRTSIVVLHFKAPRLPPAKDFLGIVDRNNRPWGFAVANESTGWNFYPGLMSFHTRDDSMEPDPTNAGSGWVTFLAPPGRSYIAVINPVGTVGDEGRKLLATPFPDHISVDFSADSVKRGMVMDFIEMPRFAVQVANSQSLIYAGTIVRSNKCDKDQQPLTCPYELSVIDESELAKTFVGRYKKGFAIPAPMQTQLLTIPQTRTIEIRAKQ